MAAPHSSPIGVIGVGDLGLAICTRLNDSGLSLMAYDVDADALGRATSLGATSAASITEVGNSCEIVLILVVSDDQVSVVGTELLSAMAPGGCVVVHSTVRPAAVIDLGREASARRIDLLDIGVGGDREQALLGTLTLMVGGDPAVLEKHASLFSSYGDKAFHMGPIGAGVAAKLVNNLLVLVGYAAQLEAMQLASEFGIDEDQVTSLMRVCEGDSRGIHIWGRHDRARRNRLRLGINWYGRMGRDLEEASAAAHSRGLALPLTDRAIELLPDKLRERDRFLDARGGYVPQPLCEICNVELAAPYEDEHSHPECRYLQGSANER